MSVKKCFRIYGEDGHRQRMSFFPSCFYDLSGDPYTEDKNHKVWIRNSDLTGTNDYSEIIIERSTEEEVYAEIKGQVSDGFFEECRTGDVVEIFDTPDELSEKICADYQVDEYAEKSKKKKSKLETERMLDHVYTSENGGFTYHYRTGRTHAKIADVIQYIKNSGNWNCVESEVYDALGKELGINYKNYGNIEELFDAIQDAYKRSETETVNTLDFKASNPKYEIIFDDIFKDENGCFSSYYYPSSARARLGDLIQYIERSNYWSCVETRVWERLCEKLGIDYHSYDDPDKLWGDIQIALGA